MLNKDKQTIEEEQNQNFWKQYFWDLHHRNSIFMNNLQSLYEVSE